MNEQPREGIVVLGSPRSGTTLMRRLLDAHPNIACPGETNIFNACARFLHRERIAGGVDIGVLSGLRYAGFDDAEVLSSLREFAFDFHRRHASRAGKPRWAEKTAFDAFYLETIDKLVGDHVLYICMLRHGLDVVCSLQELCERNGGYLSELHDYIKIYPRSAEAFAHVWVDLTRRLLEHANLRDRSTIVIRYEDLVADPAKCIGSIFRFLGEEWNPKDLEGAMASPGNVGLGDWKTYQRKQVDGNSVNRWRKLPRQTVDELASILNPTLEQAGYDPVPSGKVLSNEEVRRRYELGLMLGGLKDSR